MSFIAKNVKQILSPFNIFTNITRDASKKTGGSTRNPKKSGIKKHRGWKRQDGAYVHAGTSLVLQRILRFHPGLNVGFGRNATLVALIPGRVYVTCERADVNWEHNWVKKCHTGKEHVSFFKKYYNVVPEPQHQNFKLVDMI